MIVGNLSTNNLTSLRVFRSINAPLWAQTNLLMLVKKVILNFHNYHLSYSAYNKTKRFRVVIISLQRWRHCN